MRTRLIAAVAVGAIVTLGTSGCSLISSQATTIEYSPGDGVNISNESGPLEVRNALIVANEDGTEGNLAAAIVNTADSAETLNIEVGEGAGAISLSVRVPAAGTLSLGDGDTAPLFVEGLDAIPGATVSVYFQSGDGDGARTEVPVLDGTQDFLRHLEP